MDDIVETSGPLMDQLVGHRFQGNRDFVPIEIRANRDFVPSLIHWSVKLLWRVTVYAYSVRDSIR